MGPQQLPLAGPGQTTPLNTLHDPSPEQSVVRLPQQGVRRQPRNDESRVNFRCTSEKREPSQADGLDRRRSVVSQKVSPICCDECQSQSAKGLIKPIV